MTTAVKQAVGYVLTAIERDNVKHAAAEEGGFFIQASRDLYGVIDLKLIPKAVAVEGFNGPQAYRN